MLKFPSTHDGWWEKVFIYIPQAPNSVVQELQPHMEQHFSNQAGNLLTHVPARHGVSQSIFPQKPGSPENLAQELSSYHSISPSFD